VGGKNGRIDSSWGCIVSKAEPIPVPSTPVVEKPLISSVPRSLGLEKVIELVKFVLSWGKNHNAGVEDIGPTNVRNCSERMRNMKQMGDWTDWKYVCI